MAEMTKLGKYEIRRELGKGAMGIVYEGFDPMIERVVAIKTILPAQLDKSQAAEILARFKREAQAAGRLNHPHIVAIYEYGEDSTAAGERGAVAFIAMEYVKGRELKDYFDSNERFPLREIDRIMCEILDALGHAHKNGVTHRDIKPANVILLPEGAVKVADFGIARIETSDLTQAGSILGTPSYMSPEQFMGLPVDGRSDLFSCGVMLYQLLTGERPFTGAVTTIMHKVLKEEPLAPSMLNTTLPPAWDAVVKKAMAKDPVDRFQTAAEFAAAIKSAATAKAADETFINLETQTLVGSDVVSAKPAAASAAPPQAAARPAPPPSPGTAAAPAATPAPVKSGSRTPVLIGVAAAVLVAIGAGAYLYLAKERGPADSKSVAQNAQAPAPAPIASNPPAPAEAAPEPGTMVISALGLADPKDPRFNGDQASAQAEARADAKRQLVEKALALYIDRGSLDKNYALIEQKLLSRPGDFIKSVSLEAAPEAGKDGLIATETRATIKVREVQKSLNQMSKEERVDFIRNNGDPKISVLMTIRNVDTAQAMPSDRSQLAENVIKERIKSFGFRVWSAEGETKTAADAKTADFHILGEAKLKRLSARLEASGITVTKTVLTSWTIKAVDKATGEEIYLNTTMPKAQSWGTEDQALAEIGKMVGEQFSKGFFMQHFNFGEQKINLNITGLPDPQSARLLLREFRAIRQVLDARLLADPGKFQLQLPEGNASDMVQDAILKPLNAKLGQNCFTFAGAVAIDINVGFSSACTQEAVRARLETVPPAGLLSAPESRGKALLKGVPKTAA